MARVKSRGFSPVVAGTWCIFSSYGKYGPSKLVFVHLIKDSCLVPRYTSGISSRLGRPIGMLLKVRLETQGLFPGATVILGFLSVFKRSQALLPFESLNSAFLSSVKEMGGLLSR